MGFKENQGIKYYQFDSFQDLPIFHAVMTRHGGFSKPPYDSLNTGGTVGDDPLNVLKNHQKIFDVLGYDYCSRFDVWQVHGTEIICTDKPRHLDSPHEKADGILTDQHHVTLFMRFADCVPILFFDPDNTVIGIVHAGWQGTVQRVVQAAVEKMIVTYGSNPKSLFVGIGPAICSDCYEVGEDVYHSFKAAFGDETDQFFYTNQSRLHLDLGKANSKILMDIGVERIENANICTACHPDDWYSHRRQKGNTGRFGVIMSLDSPGEKA